MTEQIGNQAGDGHDLEQRLAAMVARFETHVGDVVAALDKKLRLVEPESTDETALAPADDDLVELLEANEALEGRLSELKVRCDHLEVALDKAETELERRRPSEALETQLEELSARCRELEAGKAAVTAAVGRNAGTLHAVSREMRLPLQGMLGLLQPLHACKRLDDVQSLGVAATESSVQLLLCLLDSFEDLAAIEDDRFEPECAVFDLHRTMQGAVSVLGPVADSLGLELTLTIDPSVPQRITGDAVRLQRLLLHLTSQAVGFAVQGEVRLSAMLQASGDSAPVVRFSVFSDGAGVPVERLRELLDPVSAAARATEDDDVDMRLGMMMYKQLTQVLGGEIGVEAIDDEGFVVWFSVGLDAPGSVVSQRTSVRSLQEMLVCNLGPIIDLSVGGMRVLCKKMPRQKTDITIIESGHKIRLKSVLVWARKLDNSYVEAGFRFIRPTNDQLEYLHRTSIQHAIDRQFEPDMLTLPDHDVEPA